MSAIATLKPDALQHPWAWCGRSEFPGTRVRFIPERQVLQVKLTGSHQTISGETVNVGEGVVMEIPSEW